MNTQSDTPETDASELDMSGAGLTIITKFVTADFARKMERKYNAAIEALNRIAELESTADGDIWTTMEAIGAIAHNATNT